MTKIAALSTLTFLLDQGIKWLIVTFLSLGQSIVLIPGFWNLTYVVNEGAAWSILSGNRLFLIFITVMTIIFIYYYFLKGKKFLWYETIVYGLLFGGILGNLWDRIFHGYVIDYLEFFIFGSPFPVFNLADICIVLSVFSLIILIWKGDKNGNSGS